MLRLAIGTRSQLCHVADGFKIVVIVEASDASSAWFLYLVTHRSYRKASDDKYVALAVHFVWVLY